MPGVSVLKTGLYQKTDLQRLEASMTKFTKFLSDDAGGEASSVAVASLEAGQMGKGG